jgi:hypothetical protein
MEIWNERCITLGKGSVILLLWQSVHLFTYSMIPTLEPAVRPWNDTPSPGSSPGKKDQFRGDETPKEATSNYEGRNQVCPWFVKKNYGSVSWSTLVFQSKQK